MEGFRFMLVEAVNPEYTFKSSGSRYITPFPLLLVKNWHKSGSLQLEKENFSCRFKLVYKENNRSPSNSLKV